MSIAIAVMVSGKGSNLQAILEAINNKSCPVNIRVVIANRADALALDIARQAGVEHVVYCSPANYPDRESFDMACAEIIQQYHCQWVVLAGYMRILSSAFVQCFAARILNIHPSLLPAFSGAYAVRDALAYGVKVSGCTVHLVDEKLDHGPILAQTTVPVCDDDDAQQLHQRIHVAEHQLYPEVLKRIVQEGFQLKGRLVIWNHADPTPCQQN